MFIHEDATNSFKKDISGRYVSGAVTGMLNIPEKCNSEARNFEKDAFWYRIAIIVFSALLIAFNVAMLVWPPVYGAFQWMAGNALVMILIFHNANMYSRSKQGISYQSGRESIKNIKALIQ